MMVVWWQQIGNTVCEEFSDLPDVTGLTRVTLRLMMAAILGGILGFEREPCAGGGSTRRSGSKPYQISVNHRFIAYSDNQLPEANLSLHKNYLTFTYCSPGRRPGWFIS